MGLVSIGKITKRQGLSGELRVLPFNKDLSSFKSLEKIYIETSSGQEPSEFIVEKKRFHRNFAILKLKEINTPESADQLLKRKVMVFEDQLSDLEDDEFYFYQLKGMSVYTTEGKNIGVVKGVMDNGAQDILIVVNDEKELLIPFVKRYISKTSVKKARIVVKNISDLRD